LGQQRDLLDQQEGRVVLRLKRHGGFTLVELMIVVVVLAVLLAIAVPSYRGWIVNAQIRTKAESVLSGLQIARVEALKRNTAVFFDMAADTSWSVGCVAPIADNDGDGVPDCPSVIQSKTAAEGGGAVTVAIAPAASSRVTYNGMGQVRPLNADNSVPVTEINFDSGALVANQSRELRIVVAGGGLARMCDPTVTTAGDPRKC
jgi:type IV fimbrial biogenesis protein FimT